MAIPQNFACVEQQVLSVTSTSASVTFANVKNAAFNAKDLLISNGGTKACQVLIGTGTLTAVQDASAGGTAQLKILSGEVRACPKGNNLTIAAITEGSDTTTLYLEAGQGG